MPFRPLSTRQNLPYVVSLEQPNANLRVPGALNGSSPPQTGELCYHPPPCGCLSSMVRVRAYYDAPLVPTDSGPRKDNKQADCCLLLSSPLPSPQLSPPSGLHLRATVLLCDALVIWWVGSLITVETLGLPVYSQLFSSSLATRKVLPLYSQKHLKNTAGPWEVTQNLTLHLQITICEHSRSLLEIFRLEKFKGQLS